MPNIVEDEVVVAALKKSLAQNKRISALCLEQYEMMACALLQNFHLFGYDREGAEPNYEHL